MENATIPAGTIVVGIDGSAGSDRALEWAIEQARVDHRGLTLVHSNGPARLSWMDGSGIDYVQIMGAMETAGREVLDDATALVARVDPDIVVRTWLDLADPRVLVLELSRSAAMVVLGSRGRGPFLSTLLGSVSAAIAHGSRCPVVVVRPGRHGSSSPATGLHDGVLVAVDGSEESQAAVEFAFLQASQHDLPLTAMYCFLPSLGGGGGPIGADESGFEELWLLLSEALSGMREKYPDVAITQRVEAGDAAQRLALASRSMNLVVLGDHARPSLPVFFTGHTDASVLEHAECVVAIVPAEA